MASPTLTPLLMPAESARANDLLWQPLFSGAPEEAPVIVLIEDGEPITEERLDSLGLDKDEAFEEALEELGRERNDAAWQSRAVPVKGAGPLTILVREGGGATVEEVLVPAVMAKASEMLGGASVAVAMPARGALLATSADQKWQLVAAFGTAARMQHERAGEAALWAGLVRVEDGKPVGVIDLSTASLDAAANRQKA